MRRKTLTLFYQKVDAGAHLSGGILAHPNRSRSIDTLWNALPRLTGPVRSPERPNGITSNKLWWTGLDSNQRTGNPGRFTVEPTNVPSIALRANFLDT